MNIRPPHSEDVRNADGDHPSEPSRAIRLMREIRFSIDRDWADAAHGLDGFEGAHPVTNSWGGWPSAVGIVPFLVLRAVVSGSPDPVTGFLVNIHDIDRLLRSHAIPQAAAHLNEHGVHTTGEHLLQTIRDEVRSKIPAACRLESLRLWTTPYLSFSIDEGDASMVELTQCFEFSASHRLHVSTLSDEENRRIFGKCNNPRSHGHNYQVEITIGRALPEPTGKVLALPKFEAIVKKHVIDRLDHAHLNEDLPEFAELNPTVENIVRVIWDLLKDQLAPAELRCVRVWETAKTYAEYRGG